VTLFVNQISFLLNIINTTMTKQNIIKTIGLCPHHKKPS